MATAFKLDDSRNQYQLFVDQRLVSYEVFVPEGDVWDFVHTRTVDGETGKGYATTLVRDALDDMRAHHRMVRPYCPFVRDFIADNADYVDLVPANERARFNLPA